MKKSDEHSSQLNLMVIALVALIAILSLVALVFNTAPAVPAGEQSTTIELVAQDSNLAGSALSRADCAYVRANRDVFGPRTRALCAATYGDGHGGEW